MGDPLTFDIVVASVFLVAAGAGALLGIYRVLLAVLMWFVVGPILGMLFLSAIKPILGGLIPVLIYAGLLLALTIVIAGLIPRPRSAAVRVIGLVFALLPALWMVVIVAEATVPSHDRENVRNNSIAAPVIFAVRDTLTKLLPDNPDTFFQKRERPQQ